MLVCVAAWHKRVFSCAVYLCRMVDDRVVVNVNDGNPLNPPSKFRGEPTHMWVWSVRRRIHCACQVTTCGLTQS